MLDLVIITGASKGIGASIAAKCASMCKKLIIISSSKAIFDTKIEAPNCEIIPLMLDLHNHQHCYSWVKATIDKLDNINTLGLVLCGGQIGEPGGLFTSDLNEWDKLYRCNVLGNLAIVKACSDLIKLGKSRIVFFGGGGAAFAYPDFSGYALSKVATVRAAENISVEFAAAGYNSSVIAIAPGAVDTDILKKVIANGGEIRTRTDISEPTNFVFNFLTDVFPSQKLNGKFLHVRDNVEEIDFNECGTDLFKLRRIS